jgi:probable HAF family extracellular repeat protein
MAWSAGAALSHSRPRDTKGLSVAKVLSACVLSARNANKEATVKSRILTCITAMTLFAALAVPVQLAAQHTRYKLVIINTFGGPESYINPPSVLGSPNQINNRGTAVGSSGTSIPTTPVSSGFVCGGLDGIVPLVNHAFKWQNGMLTDLGSLGGPDDCSVGTGINARGEVLGNSENGIVDPVLGVNEVRAVVWKGGAITDVGTFGGNESTVGAIDNQGEVVGEALNTVPDPFSFIDFLLAGNPNGTQTRAFRWEHDSLQDLGTLGGDDAFAVLINDQGQIAGISYTNRTPNSTTGIPTVDPFFWNGAMVDVGSLGGTFGFTNAMNNRGQVVGDSDLAGDLTVHPFLWDRGVLTDLGTLGGDNGHALWINNAGEVVGEADLPGSQRHHAFLWKNGVMTDLGTLGSNSHAEAINSKGQVVGRSRLGDPTNFRLQRAFLWENGGPMIDLNTLIPANSTLELQEAIDINERGEIAGLGVPSGCDFLETCGLAFLLIPCGEGTQRCGDNAQGSTAATPNSPVPITNSMTRVNQGRPTRNEAVAAWRARLAQRYRIPSIRAPRD